MPQDKQKMSLSMFGDDELAENAFRQETKSFQGGLSNSRSSKRTAGRKIENFTQVTASCFTKQGYDNSALPSPAFEYNPMQQQKTPSTMNEFSGRNQSNDQKGYVYDPIAQIGEYIATHWMGAAPTPQKQNRRLIDTD